MDLPLKNIDVHPGTLLVAEPFLMDGPFKRSVVLMTEHRDDGSVGFILNKPIDMNITEVIGSFPDFEASVFYGGPVATDTVHYLHNVGELLEGSNMISRGLYWGGDFEKVKILVANGLITQNNIRFFIGYSGWSGGQLMEELEEGTWILEEVDTNYVFKQSKIDLWTRVLENKGETYSVIAKIPESPIHN